MDSIIPERIGKYVIKAELGAGATSKVYLAHDPFTDQDFAIKLVDDAVFERADDEVARSGFMTEAALVGKLDHPHVIKIYDVVSQPNLHYVVMEYAAGGTLEKFCESGHLMDREAACDVIFTCAKALEYVHEQGLVHRDIKPGNILLSSGTEVKITDFGAAAIRSVSRTLRIKAGSPLYMSPEQITGGEADFRGDIYSLGVVMYRMVCGQLPFNASHMDALLHQIVNVKPDPPSRLHPGLPPAIDKFVLRALEKDPAKRFASWSEFNEALLAATHTAPGTSVVTGIGTSKSDKFTLLRGCKFFEQFSEPVLWALVEEANIARHIQGDVLMREGQVGEGFFVVLSGEVRITKQGRLIDVATPGQSVGEMSYILKSRVPRTASCVVSSDAVLVHITDDWLRRAPLVCRSLFEQVFLRLMAARLVETSQRLVGVGIG
jgi:eukaryotic-like serine/threonine-protein kinase